MIRIAEFSKEIGKYFEWMENEINREYKIAEAARKKGFDPVDKVEIPKVKNMAERVEGIISVVAPQIIGSGAAERIKELEEKYGSLDWRIALTIALEIAQEKFCKFENKLEAMEIGIRAGFAYITMGVVASPLEGFLGIKLRKTKSGKEYFALRYAGPIRSAGGTGASVSVIIADYVRKNMGYDPYDPTEEEIKRMSTELYDYHERITNLQYLPSEEEIEFFVKNLSVQIDGDPSEEVEVSNYKDLERIETNTIRNGVCLTLGEGLCQKAPKLWKQINKWGKDFGLDNWLFLKDFVDLQKKIKAKGAVSSQNGEKPKISPDYTFIKDLVAGRPVFGYPMKSGGLRLRFGRARTSGYSAGAISPATMYVMNDFMAIGTQLKMERPGKACTLTSCDTLEGPVVLFEDGAVERIEKKSDLKGKPPIKEILFSGDILINYGDFLDRNHRLFPPGYCEEWWIQELEKSVVDMFGSLDTYKLSELSDVPQHVIDKLFSDPLRTKIKAEDAIKIAKSTNTPLHPQHTYHFNSIDNEILKRMIISLGKSKVREDDFSVSKIIVPFDAETKRAYELVGIPHFLVSNEFIIIKDDEAKSIYETFSMKDKSSDDLLNILDDNKGKSNVDIINKFSSVKIRDKSGIFVGTRMGRPEKAKMRKLTGSPQVLFPIGEEGGRLRSFQAAVESGKVTAEFAVYYCTRCKRETVFSVCDQCWKKTKKVNFCEKCGYTEDESCVHGPTRSSRKREIPIKEYFFNVLKKLGMSNAYPDLIKGVRGTSNKSHIPEHIAKGILRAKHEIYVNKDGTTRYDMTQLPLTHFKPKEIGTSIEKLKELGYTHDIHKKEITDENQVIELKPQDIVLPRNVGSSEEGADKVLFRVAKFMDEMLEKLYGLAPFYNLKSEEDLAGQLVLCLAPHTSAGIIGRIIGFSNTQGFFAHPAIHAATRRDCDGDEACVSLLLDVLLNFSRYYLPAHRGSTQDAPLVLTSLLTPSEVDDMIFNVDFEWSYPLEFYEACMEYKYPYEIKLDIMDSRLGTEKQYEDFGFTHDTSNINKGVLCSSYKTLPTMQDKLLSQMELAEKLRSVDPADVATLVIEKHFMKDLKGNLRKFSMQKFRCVACNEKFRRPPLSGKCTACGGKIIFTISEGSVIKYFEPSMSIAKKYKVKPYLVQTLELLERRLHEVFGKEKEKQSGLGEWFS